MASTFQPLRDVDPDLVKVQEAIAAALSDLDRRITGQLALYSAVVAGVNGAGTVLLPPVRIPDGTILRQAKVGARLVAAVNLTGLTDAQGSFAQQVTTAGQIQQTSISNLSAAKFLIVVSQ